MGVHSCIITLEITFTRRIISTVASFSNHNIIASGLFALFSVTTWEQKKNYFYFFCEIHKVNFLLLTTWHVKVESNKLPQMVKQPQWFRPRHRNFLAQTDIADNFKANFEIFEINLRSVISTQADNSTRNFFQSFS